MEHKDSKQQSQPGSGSAENRGQERSGQKNQTKDMAQQDKQKVADDIGEDPSRIANLRDMGALSGLDDSSGGSGDRMEGENTGKRTDW